MPPYSTGFRWPRPLCPSSRLHLPCSQNQRVAAGRGHTFPGGTSRGPAPLGPASLLRALGQNSCGLGCNAGHCGTGRTPPRSRVTAATAARAAATGRAVDGTAAAITPIGTPISNSSRPVPERPRISYQRGCFSMPSAGVRHRRSSVGFTAAAQYLAPTANKGFQIRACCWCCSKKQCFFLPLRLRQISHTGRGLPDGSHLACSFMPFEIPAAAGHRADCSGLQSYSDPGATATEL